jgi:hypothetical protein
MPKIYLQTIPQKLIRLIRVAAVYFLEVWLNGNVLGQLRIRRFHVQEDFALQFCLAGNERRHGKEGLIQGGFFRHRPDWRWWAEAWKRRFKNTVKIIKSHIRDHI